MGWEPILRRFLHRYFPLRSARMPRCRCAGACRCATTHPFILYRAIELESEFYRAVH